MASKLLILGYISSSLLLVFAVIALVYTDKFIHNFVTSSVSLKPGTDVFNQWLNPPLVVYFNFYLFDIKNGLDFQNGGKPALEEIGPFVFREYITKESMVDNLNNTLTYNERRWYEFLPDKSAYPLTKQITSLNMGPITVLNQVRNIKNKYVHSIVDLALQLTYDDNLLVTKTVNEILFGYEDPFLKEIHKYFPHLVPTDIVGLFAGKNDTIDGTYTIFTGEDDYKKVGVVERFNYLDHVDVWSTKYANMLNGTDGTIFAPFVDKNDKLYIFENDLCRSLYATNNGTAKTLDNIDLLVYTSPMIFFANSSVNPDNAGFCTPPGNCLPTGLLNLTQCLQGVPIISSSPHFLYCDEKYVQQIDGVYPDYEKHHTSLYLEPTTGVLMKAHKRLQFSTQLFKDPEIQMIQNISEVLYPLFWIDENFEIDQANADKFYHQVKLPLAVISMLKYILLFVGFILLAVSLGVHYVSWRKGRSVPSQIEVDENTPLINDA